MGLCRATLIAALAAFWLAGSSVAQIVISPERLDFGSVRVGEATVQGVAIFSVSTVAMLDLSLTGPFAFVVTPPNALAAGRPLTVLVQFRPVVAGPVGAELRGKGIAVALRGVGLPAGAGAVAVTPPTTRHPPAARLAAPAVARPASATARVESIPEPAAASAPAARSSPASLVVSDAQVWISLYSPQDTETATATISGISGVAIGSVVPATAPGIFALASTCPAHPASAATCTITATAAAAEAPESESVDIDSPDGVVLGRVMFMSSKSYVEFSATPASIDFGGVSVGDKATRQIIFADRGGWDSSLATTIAAPDAFSFSSCGRTLRVGRPCTLVVAFAPTAQGPFSGSITLSSLNTSERTVIPVSGTGLPWDPTMSAGSLSFAGTSGETHSVSLFNPTSHVINILGVTASESFAASAACTSFAPGQSCPVAVQYLPTAAMNGVAQDGQLSIFTGEPAAVSQVALHVAANRASLAIDRSAIQFGRQQVGTVGPAERITITNAGQASATVGVQSAGDFVAANGCGTLAPGASCTVGLAFAPGAAAARNGIVVITGGGAMQTVGLAGEGVAPLPKPNRNVPLSIASGALGGVGLNLGFRFPRGAPAPGAAKDGIEVKPNRVEFACAVPARDEAAPLTIDNFAGAVRHVTYIVAGPFEVTGCEDLPAKGNCVAGITFHGRVDAGATNGLLVIADGGSADPIAVVQLEASVVRASSGISRPRE
ncbi:MAG TPA: choice-of-anchor D domain-containing protein [Terriglobales bacterium]|nr:choice-of-anchor D domain-containing protein [Terriglobales bacterium]